MFCFPARLPWTVNAQRSKPLNHLDFIGEGSRAIQKAVDRIGSSHVCSFSVLAGVGYKAINNGPPIPTKVITTDGHLLFTGDTIRDGQNVWQSTGGQEIGTIWGHGAYVAPDWSADYLHRQSEIVLHRWARQQGFLDYYSMPAESRAALQGRLTELTRRNTYDAASNCIVLDADRAAAFEELAAYYADVYGNGRDAYANSCRRLERSGQAATDGYIFLVDRMGREHEPSGSGCDLRAKLAPRRVSSATVRRVERLPGA